ncbi:hydroxyphenylacetyl-CoA thioesterase PaaI [Roseateles sp. SL47]|jgi:acyl-CoA thioesterase|uniref:hydroxyphenylacetyl-CoA thioesterase PaaI n=1 Tax=Roseateles sp. SL47 TaxID=2995138 RepID=UPI00226FA2A0|nr:hydroxyphenylacetyl-CoA thioesterase PaaI [Roseateles sp. SL47]WAC75628.1 hydroxyphenylacetyl-CoA thioesterase PaaI [Roseateles sp. SL47]
MAVLPNDEARTVARRVSRQALAEAVRDALFANDRATRGLGIEVLAIAPGSATLRMAVRADMLNGFDICHGGCVTTLADSTFAFACNSHNEMTVASGFAIDIVAPSRLGDVLTAVAAETSLAGRTGVYDITITNQRDELIAVFRGRSYRLKGKPVVAGLIAGPNAEAPGDEPSCR